MWWRGGREKPQPEGEPVKSLLSIHAMKMFSRGYYSQRPSIVL